MRRKAYLLRRAGSNPYRGVALRSAAEEHGLMVFDVGDELSGEFEAR